MPDRERQRDTERDRERQRKTERDREGQRETERDKQRYIGTETAAERDRDREKYLFYHLRNVIKGGIKYRKEEIRTIFNVNKSVIKNKVSVLQTN